MLNAKLPLAVCIALTLTMGGCTTLKGKKNTEEQITNNNQSQQDEQKKQATDAEAAALAEQERLKAQALAEQERLKAEADALRANANTGDDNYNGSGKSLAALLATRIVNFDYDSAELSSDDLNTLQAHAQYLKANPQAQVLLAGHADERGTREYNMALGERRANAVQAFFSSNGVKSSQLDTVSYGKEKPINEGHDESAWAENRRVEIGYQRGEPR